MLIGMLSGASLCIGLAVCLLTGAFGGLSWLWLLPACFVGGFLLLVLAWFVMMQIMASAVNMEQEQQEDSPFYRWVVDLTIAALVKVLRVKIRTEGLEKTPKDGRFLLVCNHLHDTDPVVLLWAFRRSQLAFVSKRENDAKFLIGPFLRKLLCQPINRENDREALKTILRCIQILKEDKASIGVFPEGYCSLDRRLHPFRSGVFKIAQKAKVPIVVCTIRDTHRIYDNIRHMRGSEVELHLLDVIPAEELQGRTAVDVAAQVHAMMAGDLGPNLVMPEET